MFYEYSLLSSFIGSAITLLIIRFSYISLQKRKKTGSSENNGSGSSGASLGLDTNINMLLFFLGFIALAKIVYSLVFPLELSRFTLADTVTSPRFLFLVFQQISAIVLLFLIILFTIQSQMKFEYRINYLGKVLNITLSLVVLDLLSSVAFFSLVSSSLLSIEPAAGNLSSAASSPFTVGNEYLLLFVSLSLYFFFYMRFQKKRNRLTTGLYLAIFIVTYALIIYFSISYAAYFFKPETLLYSAMEIFPKAVFFWIILLMVGIGCQVLSVIILGLRTRFFNIHQGVQYILQLNKVVLVCTVGLSGISLLPLVFRIFIS